MKRYRWLRVLLVTTPLLIAVLLLGSCGFREGSVKEQPVTLPDEGEQPTSPPALPASDVILMDGEMVAVYPSLKLAFSGNVNARLLALHVEIGQRIKKDDLIAVLSDEDLQKAVADAQLVLDRAREDLAQAQADAEEKYHKAVKDADKKYQREMENADEKYEREKRDAESALETAEYNLQRAKMQPPTTAVEEAKVNLGRAMEAEAAAADNYKQALDRPWEPQSIRDSYYQEWQQRIVDRQLAELRFQDARISLQVYYLDLEAKERDVENARKDLADIDRDDVDKDDVDKETNFTSYERAIADAEEKLVQAREELENVYLYAPWDGLILSIDASIGAMASSGTSIVTLLNVGDLYFITQNLSERHIAQIRKGQQANITLRTFPDVVLTGQVYTIVPQVERKADAEARFTAYIRLDESELDLLPGMTGRVEIVTD